MVQIYEGDFGASPARHPSAKARRMTKRQLKKRLVRELKDAWESAPVVRFPADMPAKLGTFA